MKMLTCGEWVDGAGGVIEVLNPYDNTVVDTIPKAGPGDIERTLAFAAAGAPAMRRFSGYER